MSTMIKRFALTTNLYNGQQAISIQGGRVVKAMVPNDLFTEQIDLLVEMDVNTSSDAIAEPTNFIVLSSGSGTPKGVWQYIDSVVTRHGMLLHIFQERKAVAELLEANRLAIASEMTKSIMDPAEIAEIVGMPEKIVKNFISTAPDPMANAVEIANATAREGKLGSDEPSPEEISPSTGYSLHLSYNVTVYFGSRSEILFRGRASHQGVLTFIKRFTEKGGLPDVAKEMMQLLKRDGHLETANHILDGMKYSMVITKANQ